MSEESVDDLKGSDSNDDSYSWSWSEISEYTSSDEHENSLYDSEDGWLETAKSDEIFWYFYSQKKVDIKPSIHSYRKASPALLERKQFIVDIMDAFKFGPIFDTFCFSLPRPKQLEDGYKQSVKNVENILLQCQNGLIKSTTVNFPTYSSKQMAKKLIQNLNRKLEKAHIYPVLCNTGQEVEVEKKGDKKPADLDLAVDKNKKDGTFDESSITESSLDDKVTVDTSKTNSRGTKRGHISEQVLNSPLRKFDKNKTADNGNNLDSKVAHETQGQSQAKKRGAGKGNNKEEGAKKTKLEAKPKDNPTEKASESIDDDDDDDPYYGFNCQEIIEIIIGSTFPCSLVHMLSDGKTNILSSWYGQIQCHVNPISQTLSILMFDYLPTYSAEIRSEILNGKFTRPVTKEIRQQIEKFECCRLMRMDIQLNSLQKLSVVHQNDTEMIFYCKLIPPVKFYQRFINTSASDRNKWKERQPFLPFDGKCFTECSQEYMLVLGGSVSEMSDIVAQIMTCDPELTLHLKPSKMALFKLEKKIKDTKGNKDYSLRHKDIDKKSPVQVNFKQRDKILNILKKYGLISKEVHDKMKGIVKVYEVKGQVETYNCLDDLDFHPCFKDYINFRCIDSEELEKHLKSNFNKDGYLYTVDSLDLKYPENYDMEKLTVAKHLKAEKNRPYEYQNVYFSFCHSNPEEMDIMRHCDVCKSCMDWNNWHCPICDRCANVADPRCEYCGFENNIIIVQPYTYYMRFFWSPKRKVVKKEWDVKLSTTDIPVWMQQIDVDTSPKKEFLLKEYLNHDNLGILNLWNLAFCIASKGPRKYVNRNISQRFRGQVDMGVTYSML